MAEPSSKPIDVTEDTSRYTEALRLGLREGTPQFYEYIGYKAGKGDWEKTTPAQDIGLVDIFLDSITHGNHLAESRRLREAQIRADELLLSLKKIRAVEDLTRQADERTVNRLVPEQTVGQARDIYGPETFAAAGGRVPMTAPEESLGLTIAPPERPLPTRGPMIAPFPAMGASSFAPKFDVPGDIEPQLPAFRTPERLNIEPSWRLGMEPTILQPREILDAPMPPLVKRGIIEAVGAMAKAPPEKQTGKQKTEDFLFRHYLKTGNIDRLERLGGIRESLKDDVNEAKKFGDVLKEGGVEPGSQEWQAHFKEFAEKMKKPIGTIVTTNVNTKQETEESKTVGKGFGEEYIALQRAGVDANMKISKLDRFASLSQGVTTGKLIPTLTEVEALGATFGFKVNPDLPAKQALESLSNEIALELRNTGSGNGMPGQLSDKDREFLVAMTPNLSKTPEGNKLIIETRKKLLQREREVARLAREYRKKNGHIDEGFYDKLQSYADKNPLFSTGKPWEKYKK